MAFEGQDDFYIAKLLVEPGAEVPVGSPILVSVEDASDVAAFEKFVAPTSATSAVPTPPPALASTPVPVAAPAPVPVVSKVEIAAPIKTTVVATPPPITLPSATPLASVEGTYSVRSKATSIVISPLNFKLSQLANDYNIKYGRAKLEKPKEEGKGKVKA